MILITPGIKRLIEGNALALATVDQKGRPHAIALACCKVFGNQVIITNTHIRESIANIKNDQHVSLAVWPRNWEQASVGFELKGTAENITQGRWFEFVSGLSDNRRYKVKSAIVVTVTKIKKLL